MTLIATTSWRDYLAPLTVHPDIGTLYASMAPLFAAFGVPSQVGPGDIELNFASGSSYYNHSNSTFATSASPAQVDYSITYKYGYVSAQAQLDINSKYSAGTFALQKSTKQAMVGIYKGFAYQALYGTGANNQIYGADTMLALTMPTTLGMQVAGDGTAGNVLANMAKVLAKLPQSGYNVCVTSPQQYANILTQMSKLGGARPGDIGRGDAGFPYLEPYPNTIVISSWEVALKGANVSSDIYMFNIGPEGVMPVTSPVGLWEVSGPNRDPGVLADVYDLTLVYQLLYQTPRAVGCLRGQTF